MARGVKYCPPFFPSARAISVKTCLVFVVRPAFPVVERLRDLVDVVRGKIPQDAVFHVAKVAGVDEERLAGAVAEGASGFLVLRQKPDARGNLRVGEELTGERHHALDQVGFEQVFTDIALAPCVGTHRAVGQQKRH